MLVISIVLMTILVLLVNKTKIGLVMKASEQNIVAANLVGIKVNSVISFIFILVGLSAAVASILVSSYYGMTYPNMGYIVELKALSAAVLGGIGNLPGSLVGGLIIGLIVSVGATALGSEFRDNIEYLILIIVLIIKYNIYIVE